MATQLRGEETREHLLQAAEESFASLGFDATGVSEICERAGVSKGAFYHHFVSKQEVFMVLFSRWLAGLDALLAERVKDPAIPAAAVATAAIRHVFEAGRGRLPIFLEFWSKASREPEVWRASIEPYERYRSYFATIVASGVAEGALRPVDPEMAARVLVSLAVGLLLQGLLDPDGADWGRVAEEGMKMLLEGLGNPKQKRADAGEHGTDA